MRLSIPSRRAVVAPALLAILAVVTAGCSLFFDAPDVRIAAVRVSGIGLSGASADVELEVSNPNGFALTSEGLRYRLEFEEPDAGAVEDAGARWRTIASGESDRHLTVEADERAVVTVEVPFEYRDLGRAVLRLLERGELTYRLTGDILFDAPLGGVRVPFEDTGRVGL